MEALARAERRKLQRIQSKVGVIIHKPRAQGLLAKGGGGGNTSDNSYSRASSSALSGGANSAASSPRASGGGGGGLGSGRVLDPDELTRAIIPTPAKPPDGVELKVPQVGRGWPAGSAGRQRGVGVAAGVGVGVAARVMRGFMQLPTPPREPWWLVGLAWGMPPPATQTNLVPATRQPPCPSTPMDSSSSCPPVWPAGPCRMTSASRE